MSLQFEVEDVESLDENVRSFYEEHDGKYRLKVEGIDPADELKSALQKERENSKNASQKLKELEKLAEEAEMKALEEQGKYKELSEKERADKIATQKELSDLRNQIADAQKEKMVNEFASSMTNDAVEQKIISKFALDYIQVENNEVSFNKDVKEIESELSVFIKNKASGTNDNGNTRDTGNSKTVTREQWDGMNHKERATFSKDGGTVVDS